MRCHATNWRLARRATHAAARAGGGAAAAFILALVSPTLLAQPAAPAGGGAAGAKPDPLLVQAERDAERFGVPEPLCAARVHDAWAAGADGRGIVVAVVDTGVDVDHEDLAGQCLPGYNAIDGTGDVNDTYWHGTAVAGAIAGLRQNGRGYAGVAPGAKILPVKVGQMKKERLYDEVVAGPPIDYDALAKGIVWAADHGAKVICVGVGGFVSTEPLRRAVAHAQSRGCLVVAPSGAQREANQDLYPAHYPGVVAVTAWSLKRRSELRTANGEETRVTVVYPGISPLVNVSARTDLAAAFAIGAPHPGNAYGGLQGTSAAAAIVAGVAALAWSAEPGLAAEEVRTLLKAAAVPAIGTEHFYDFFDVRIVDALRAVKLAAKTSADPGVRRIECLPLRPAAGQEAVATAVVENAGRARLDGVGVTLTAAGRALPPVPVSLGPWARARVEFRFRVPPGAKEVALRAECSPTARELDPADNVLEKTIAVVEKPRPLGYVPRLERSDFESENPAVTFTAEVVNVGGAAGSLVAQAEVNDKPIGREDLADVKAGERRAVAFAWKHPGGGEKAFVFSLYVFERGKERYEDAHDVTSMAFHFPQDKAVAVRQ